MSYSYDEAARLIIQAGLELVEKGLISRTWGNISARLSKTEFLIPPSGQAYDTLTPEKLVVVSVDDYLISFFGKNDQVANFKTALAGAFENAQIISEDDIE